MYLLFNNVSEKDKVIAIDDLIKDSTPRPSFFFLMSLSVLMATCGLLINNSAVIIGSMLIAPILSPVLSLALGIVIADGKLISRSFYTLLKSMGYAIGLSTVATLMLWKFAHFNVGDSFFNPEIMSRTEASVIYLFIAIIAGLATAFARVKPDLNEALPGTAIAVALVPPLAAIGIGIARFNLDVISGAFSMFVLNTIGIVLAAMVMFSLMNLYTKRRKVVRSVEEADAELEKQKKKSEKKNKEEEKKRK